MSNCRRTRVYLTIDHGAVDPRFNVAHRACPEHQSNGRPLHLRGYLVARENKFFIKSFVVLRGSIPRKLARHRPFHQPAPYLAVAKSLPGAFDRVPESFG